jgi:hypothetical protein
LFFLSFFSSFFHFFLSVFLFSFSFIIFFSCTFHQPSIGPWPLPFRFRDVTLYRKMSSVPCPNPNLET